MRRLAGIVAAVGSLVLVAGACGGGDNTSPGTTQPGARQISVYADSSLEQPITTYGQAVGLDADNTFGNSDELASKIRDGDRPDVYIAAGPALPDELSEEGLVERPVPVAQKGEVVYTAAVVKGAENADLAGAYIQGLLQATGAQVLTEAGLKPPPR